MDLPKDVNAAPEEEVNEQPPNLPLTTSPTEISFTMDADAELRKAKEIMEDQTVELRKSVSLLKATLESTADGIIALDLNGKVLSYNSKFLRIWDVDSEFIDRSTSTDLMTYAAKKVKEPEEFLETIKKRHSEPHLETVDVIELADGRYFERYSFPQLVNNECVGVVINFREVTERRLAERSLARFAAIVNSSHDAIVAKTLNGIVTSWNKGAERIFGYTSEEMVGNPILMIIPSDRLGEEPEILSRLSRGEGVDHFETVRIRKDGKAIDVSITLSPIRDSDGKIIGISKIARDITDHKLIEAEREDLLVREKLAREEAEIANRLKDEFLATLSHELRTPLNAILGWSSLLIDNRMTDDDKSRGLEIIQRNAQLQARLVEDVLDVSRIISGKLKLEVAPLELAPILQNAVESVLPTVEAKDIQLQPFFDSDPCLVYGDSNRLQQVIWNLLSNAIKFTPKGGRVQIRMERIYSHVEIVVSDSGVGIEPSVLPYIFERFRQADQSSTRNYGGLGLGLAIVKNLVEMHGGSVSAESEGEGRGATFTIKLPVIGQRTFRNEIHDESGSEVSETKREIPFEVPPELEGIRVLVVDDEPDARLMVQAVLEHCGAIVTTASSAAEGLLTLQEALPDVLLSDLGMPQEDGYTLIRKVRALPVERGGQTPAAALTAYARVEDRMHVLRSGFQIHIPKPVEPAELVAVVLNLVKRVG
jgi:PAS domain S-box-containing protein